MNVVLREWNLNISGFEGAKQIKVQCAFHLPCGHPTAIDPYEQFKEEGAITKRNEPDVWSRMCLHPGAMLRDLKQNVFDPLRVRTV